MNPSQGHNGYGDDQNAQRYLVSLAAATRRALMLCLLLLSIPLLGQDQQELTQARLDAMEDVHLDSAQPLRMAIDPAPGSG